ncbi:MAG: hypothetical protein AB7H66_08020 [Hyphomonadaceae bacterium]
MRLSLIALTTLALASAADADPLADRDAAGRLYRAEQWNEAAEAYGRLAAANPEFGAYFYFWGVSLAHSGRCAEAAPVLDRAVALGAAAGRPSLRRAQVELAGCAAERGDAAGAVAHLRTAYVRFGFEDFASLAEDARFASLANNAAFRDLADLNAAAPNRVAGWRSDLDRYVALVEARHPNPYHNVDAGAWRAAIAALHDDIPRLSDAEAAVGFMRLATMIGDGHTNIIPPLEGEGAFHLLPIWPYAFGNDWYIAAAAPEHRELVGARILSINGAPIAAIDAELRTMIAHDNDMTPRWVGAVGLQFAEFAAIAAHGAASEAVTMEIETAAGARSQVSLLPGPIDRNPTAPWCPRGWPSIADAAPSPPWLAHTSDAFYLAQADRNGIVYAQVNRIGDAEDETFAAFSARLGEALRQRRVRTLVLDLRHNNGGNGALNWTLVRELVRAEHINHERGLYVVVGRRTFSAAMNLASMIETHTNAIFVGEPTGSRPNFYGEDTPFRLAYSGLTGSISSAWFQGGETSDDLRPWIAPDLPAPLTLDDLRGGRDPAMAAIAAHLAEQR